MHACSAPLTSVTFYEVDQAGRLSTLSLATEDPEPAVNLPGREPAA